MARIAGVRLAMMLNEVFDGDSPVAHHRRRKRKKLGLCINCGYDLRGSEGRCPECGTAMQENGALGTMASGHSETDAMSE